MNPNIIVFKKGYGPFSAARKTMRDRSYLSFTQTYVITILAIGILGIYYVWFLNINATKGYNIRTLEIARHDHINTLNLTNMRIAEMESLEYMSNNPIVQAMEPVSTPQYLVLKDTFYSYVQSHDDTSPLGQ